MTVRSELADILRRLSASIHDEEAWGALGPAIRRLGRQCRGRTGFVGAFLDEAIEDVEMRVMMALIDGRPPWSDHPVAYVRMMIRNRCIDLQRRYDKRQLHAEDVAARMQHAQPDGFEDALASVLDEGASLSLVEQAFAWALEARQVRYRPMLEEAWSIARQKQEQELSFPELVSCRTGLQQGDEGFRKEDLRMQKSVQRLRDALLKAVEDQLAAGGLDAEQAAEMRLAINRQVSCPREAGPSVSGPKESGT